jgi:hypothetical protein
MKENGPPEKYQRLAIKPALPVLRRAYRFRLKLSRYLPR